MDQMCRPHVGEVVEFQLYSQGSCELNGAQMETSGAALLHVPFGLGGGAKNCTLTHNNPDYLCPGGSWEPLEQRGCSLVVTEGRAGQASVGQQSSVPREVT